MQAAPHEQRRDGEQRADEEGDPPAPGSQLLGRQEDLLQDEQQRDGAELPANQRDVLEAGIEAAVL